MIHSLKSTKRGFTLIELLVVIAIIGILSSVVLASLSTAREKSRDARRISDLQQIQLALELVFDQYQGYPIASTTAAAPFCPGGVTNCVPGSLAVAASAGGLGYLPKIPVGPRNDRYYYVGRLNDGSLCTTATPNVFSCYSYALGANLESSGNIALQSDADVTVGTTDFRGTLPDCGASTAGAEKCYDISP